MLSTYGVGFGSMTATMQGGFAMLRFLIGVDIAGVSLVAALAAEGRTIVTTQNGDYFGFDLRAEQNVSLDQCKATCLGDKQCRAFTYNTKAKWCFLKSDFATMKTFNGAVAGKVVTIDGEPDIGAPPEMTFFPAWMADEARQYRTSLLATPPAARRRLGGLIEAAEFAMLSNDARSARDNYIAAIRVTPDDGKLWLGLSRALLAISGTDGSDTATPQSRRRRTPAGTPTSCCARRPPAPTCWRRSPSASTAATFRARPLQAYEASLALVNSASLRAEYEDLKARKGFRVIEHTVDADTPSPRVCAQFSEELVKTGVDYAPFVTVDNAAPKAVEAKDRQICVEGLEHGKRYDVTFRPGLPAAIGEVITAPVVLSIYIQDRGASVRFTGDSFVLPSTARRGIPVVSVNTTGRRHEALPRRRPFAGAAALRLPVSQAARFLRHPEHRRPDWRAVWEGKLEIANELNKEITTSFPVDEALPNRQPGVYVLTAQPENDKSDDWASRATQWFVVSDIGLSTYTGQDGLNVFARSLGSAEPMDRRRPDARLPATTRFSEPPRPTRKAAPPSRPA